MISPCLHGMRLCTRQVCAASRRNLWCGVRCVFCVRLRLGAHQATATGWARLSGCDCISIGREDTLTMRLDGIMSTSPPHPVAIRFTSIQFVFSLIQLRSDSLPSSLCFPPSSCDQIHFHPVCVFPHPVVIRFISIQFVFPSIQL